MLKPRAESAHTESKKLVPQIKNYLDENFTEDLNLNNIANIFYISPYHLSHIFKREFEYSPMQYIKSLRLGYAQHLLMTTTLSVNKISEMCGYNNASYFGNLFKKHTLQTPNEFRETAQLKSCDSKETLSGFHVL